ncbi:TonB-dependent receptor plug domain-containing protein [Pseudovibrio sp. Alg231-02]|uniref:TonB-dependent receptor plug domain-containing protein n=1 Tax=Pseudovibrio sp. Alg231-02 TaxID=1922223 RepID=UPI000D560F17|nr:TonB-dependent receptor [Pseudovibrio sp. Alg231-02]
MKKLRWRLLVSVCVLNVAYFSTGAAAQDSVDASEELDPVVVYSFNNDRFAVAADRNTSIYVSTQAIEAAEMGDLRDVFAENASVTVGGGIPIAQKIFVNGVDALNLNMTIEGAMQNNRAFHHVTANAIDPALLRAVRVDAGVAAADSGPNALGGSIAFQLIDALDLLEDGETMGGKATLSFDTNGNTFSQALTGFAEHNGFDILAFAKNAKGQDYTSGGNWEIPGTGANLQTGLLKAGYTSETGHRFEVSGMMLKDKEERAFRANIGSLTSKPNDTTRLYDTLRKSFSFRYEHLEPTDLVDPEVVLGFSENNIDVPVPYGSNGTSNTLNGKIANTFRLTEDIGFTTGFDFYRKTANYDDPSSDLEEVAHNFGSFGQVRWTPSSALKLSAGLRLDHQRFEGLGDFDTSVTGLSGNSSASYEVLEGLKLKAGYATVFGGIALEDNYTFSSSWDYSDIKSSRSHNVTAGLEFERSGFLLSGEIFRTDISDARSRDANVDVLTEGFNLAAGYKWTSGSAKITYSNTRVEVDGDAADSYVAQDFAAPLGQVIAFNVSHKLEDYGLIIGGDVQGAFDYDTGSGDSNRTLDGYAVVGLFAEYEPEQVDGLKLRLEANNIFDEDYSDRGTYGGDYQSVNTLKEPGRSFSLTANYRF